MALQLEYTVERFDGDLVYPTAYARILDFQGDKDSVGFNVGIYSTEQARTDNKEFLELSFYEVPYQDGMAMTTLYTHLKTLPNFTGATDA